MYILIENKKGIAFKNEAGKIFFLDKKDPAYSYLEKWERGVSLWDDDVEVIFEKENFGVFKLKNPVDPNNIRELDDADLIVEQEFLK